MSFFFVYCGSNRGFMTNDCVDAPPKEETDDGMCPICLEDCDVETGSMQRCGHSFHEACIQPWLAQHTTCPVCRERIVDESVSDSIAEPIVLSLQVASEDVGHSNLYRHVCFSFVIMWLLNGRLLLALWSLSTLGRHTRCSMIVNIAVAFLVAPDILLFNGAGVVMTLIQCFLLYIQIGLWLSLWRPVTTLSVVVGASPQASTVS